ncbi:ABC transporter permease [Nocardia sp. alder85J]|uniref:ABC transporter permease n=1 Tax=Nocardia sp. alder85J TaxID=2862949 RepID=UPI001CD71100|nr:ABC transporter permease [Nocardia sp. alder85J]MCX4098959.1 ABC transporter permease [Nocardia sp. alder85J]
MTTTSLTGTLAAERIKLTSTRSPLWCAILMVVTALALAALFGLLANFAFRTYTDNAAHGHLTGTAPYLHNDAAALGVMGAPPIIPGFGYILVMIVAALTVTSEYRFGTIKVTFLATPNRALVLTAKAAVVALGAAVLSAVLTFLSYLILAAIANPEPGRYLGLGHDQRVFYGVPIFIALVVFLSVAIGALLRQSAGALSLLIVWPLLLEPIVQAFGSVGRNIEVFLPFANALWFLGLTGGDLPWHWGQWICLVYFAAFVAIVWAAAMFVVRRRDA